MERFVSVDSPYRIAAEVELDPAWGLGPTDELSPVAAPVWPDKPLPIWLVRVKFAYGVARFAAAVGGGSAWLIYQLWQALFSSV